MTNLTGAENIASIPDQRASATYPKYALGAYLKASFGNLLMACVGRRSLARIGRYFTNTARLDVANDMRTNGELLVQEVVLRNYPKDRDLVVFDVGANVGDWSAQLIGATGARNNQNWFLHAFEPVSSTMEMLQRTLQTVKSPWRVLPVQKALSDRQGTSEISVVEEGCGINAIYPDPRRKLNAPKRWN